MLHTLPLRPDQYDTPNQVDYGKNHWAIIFYVATNSIGLNSSIQNHTKKEFPNNIVYDTVRYKKSCS